MLKFLKRKKDVEEETDELEEENKPKKKRAPRKKKELPKQWGKRERLLVVSVLLITVIASGAASIKSQGFELPALGKFGFSQPSLDIFKEEKIVLYGTQEKEKDPTEVINQILDRTSYLQGEYAFVVVRLDSGYRYGINAKNEFPAASLIKLPVMVSMFKAEEEEVFDLQGEYILKESDKKDGSGSLATRPVGTKILYYDLVRLMGKESDNTAFVISRNLTGIKLIGEVMQNAQMNSTSLEKNITTPDDIASFFENIWIGELVNSDNREKILEFLTDTVYEDWITRGVPENIRVAHKYGVLENTVNDAGIVYAKDKYILVIMSSDVIREEANAVIPEISRIIYEFETSEK